MFFKSKLLVIFLIASAAAYPQERVTDTDSIKTEDNNFYSALAYTSIYYTASILVLSNTWYKDKRSVPFHFYNDNSAYLQVDKFGHTFGSYVYSYIGYHYLLNSGFSRKEALLYGATLGLVLQTPIEIMDGIHEGFGFSWGDMAANTLGSALVLGQELLFREQVIKYKFSYSESDYSRKANGYLGSSSFNRLFNDYNGHTYWFSLPVNKIIPGNIAPAWLNIAAGYGADGMYGEFKNIQSYKGVDIPAATRSRQYLVSLDIDWTKINTESTLLKLLLQALTFIKLPFPAIEYSSKGDFKAYWIYY